MKTQSEDFSTRFIVELIKPSHYDDDGYVIQWWRGFVPSNSLSAIYGLVSHARDRRRFRIQRRALRRVYACRDASRAPKRGPANK